MKQIKKHNNIKPEHLQRKAMVYVRQSTNRQVLHNKESQRLQYGLQYHAKEYGFRDVEIIDDDLGFSASPGSRHREGFERLLSQVALGEVGIIFSWEASRMSRNDKDWCHLFEVCGLFDTLIGDEEHIYNPNNIDDQMVLGIRATMSVVELKILKTRMLAGMEEKARRGELKRRPSPGYVWNSSDKLVKDPDKRVQDAMALIFKKYDEIHSIRQTFLWFHSHNVELPVNEFGNGVCTIKWKLPTKSFIGDVLRNVIYAGAYVWGRRVTEKKLIDGRVVKRRGKLLPLEEARVLIKDHHEGYISWETFTENQKMIRNNNLNLSGTDEVAGAVRHGQGLLSGILRCGHCGRKLHVRYWGKSGTAARYLCKGDFDSGGKYCIGFGGSLVDRRFSKELLEKITPYGIEASIQASDHLASLGNEEEKMLLQKLQQLEYEEKRSFEQYNEVDPRNRLVADELEKRWNMKLEEMEQIRKQLSIYKSKKRVVTERDEKALRKLGEDFESVWHDSHCTPLIRKKIIRTVIQEVIVTYSEETNDLKFIIHWQGGCHTSFTMQKVKSGCYRTDKNDIEIIRKMSIRYGDDEIARVLNKLGRRTGRGNRWNEGRVSACRSRAGIKGQKRTKKDQEIFSLGQASKYLGVGHSTIEKLVAHKIIGKEQIVPWAPWEIKKTDLDSERVRKIISYLHKTGKLVFDEKDIYIQTTLFND
jgi:DNA invertase Pin-like site-specific DNA recombinase